MKDLGVELDGTSGPCALLESTTPPGPHSRRKILARSPRAVLVADRDGCRVARPDGVRNAGADPLAALRALLGELPPGRWPDEGAVVGLMAYDMARKQRPSAPTPWLVALAVDRLTVEEDGTVVARGLPDRGPLPWAEAAWRRGAARAAAPGRPLEAPIDLEQWSSLSRQEHARLVGLVQAHIVRGDIYQANLSQRFSLPWRGSGAALYAELRRRSPAPFAGYFRACGLEVASASPERLLDVVDGVVSTRPIAGTRPRSADAAHDRALAQELILSEKERAEHLMLVDLARNDLGKVSMFGSVQVDELMTVEDFAQVRHIVSNVRARLDPRHDALDALMALFPGGTITGVPKRRCMEILDSLEPVPRGFYTGALFYVTPSSRLDANILIRSAVVSGGELVFNTGSGIVADSEAAFEYEETLHKALGMKLALEALLRGDAC